MNAFFSIIRRFTSRLARAGKVMHRYLISIASVFFILFVGRLLLSSTSSDESDLYQRLFQSRYNIFALELPHKVEFCGQRVPIELRDVTERLDRELHVNTYW